MRSEARPSLRRPGLCEYDEMEDVAWKWQSVDGSMVNAPLARETVGSNPADRGKNDGIREGRTWRSAIAERNRREPA